ncbi:MAG: VCBS repeat-containing protein [Fibrobacter sp.]|nr:VCBS repeat-containing protein [Fibrobacter sp.]
MSNRALLPVIAVFWLSSFGADSLQAQPEISLLPQTIDTSVSIPDERINSPAAGPDTANRSSATASAQTPAPLINPSVPSSENSPLDFKEVYKQTFSLIIKSVSIYDIDNDGYKETILLTDNKLFVFRYKNRAFPKLYEFKAPAGVSFVSIDIADMDNDSSPEFYLSATNTGTDSYRSMIVAFTNNGFSILKKRVPYLLRITDLINNKKMLIGQKYSKAGTHKGELYHLELMNNTLRVKDKVRIPEKSVHGFSVLKNIQSNTQVLVTQAPSGHIELIDMVSNSILTGSEGKYGGNPFTIRLSSADASSYPVSILPVRTITADFNLDGIDEIVCVKNNEAFNNMLETTKIYTRGHFEILGFEGTSMIKQLWKSGSFSGFISDLAYEDFDNNGTPDLLLIKPVRPEKTLFKKAETEIIVLNQK